MWGFDKRGLYWTVATLRIIRANPCGVRFKYLPPPPCLNTHSLHHFPCVRTQEKAPEMLWGVAAYTGQTRLTLRNLASLFPEVCVVCV